jgi:folate-dependent tRNA-U54 methylase TrmFO/GidA
MDRARYESFVEDLVGAARVTKREFETAELFSASLSSPTTRNP